MRSIILVAYEVWPISLVRACTEHLDCFKKNRARESKMNHSAAGLRENGTDLSAHYPKIFFSLK